MNIFSAGVDEDNLHHAYLVEGDIETLLPQVHDFCEGALKIPVTGNPDFYQSITKSFGIDDSRKIKELASHKAIGEKKIFIIAFQFITREAQNSLLKLFEEPTTDTHFFTIVPLASILLPTLRSRMFEIKGLGGMSTNTRAQQFLASEKSERLSLVADIVEGKDKSSAVALLSGMEESLRGESLLETSPKKLKALEEISRCRSYLYDRAPSIKMILEHVALVTPVEKK